MIGTTLTILTIAYFINSFVWDRQRHLQIVRPKAKRQSFVDKRQSNLMTIRNIFVSYIRKKAGPPTRLCLFRLIPWQGVLFIQLEHTARGVRTMPALTATEARSKSFQWIIVTLQATGKLGMGCWRSSGIPRRVMAFQAFNVFGDAFVDVGSAPDGWSMHAQVVAVSATGHDCQD